MKLWTRIPINKGKILAGGIADQIRRFWSSTVGVAATEFALVSPIFVILTLGVIDVGTAVFERFELKTAARVGAEYALTNLTDVDGITDAVVRATNHESQSISVTVFTFCECTFEEPFVCTEICDNGEAPRKFVTVRVVDFYNPVFLPEPDTPEDEDFTFSKRSPNWKQMSPFAFNRRP